MRKVGWWLPVSLLSTLLFTVALLLASPSLPKDDLAALAANDPQARDAAIERVVAGSTLTDLAVELGQNHTPLVKAGLAEAMQRLGVRSTHLDTITALLADRDPATRHAAVNLLEPHAASVWRTLADVATNEAEVVLVRAGAASVLGSAGAQARSALRKLARDLEAPGAVRHAALQALARVSAEGAIDVGGIAADTKRPFAERRIAIQALAQPGSAGDTPLTTLSASTSPTIRAAALAAMAERGGTQHWTTIANRVTDPWPGVRLQALMSLRAVGGDATHRTQVIGRLLDTDPRVLALAARLVGSTCSDIVATVKPSLGLLLASTNFRVRYEAALALFALRDTGGAATMLADGASPNLSQRQLALQAHAQITAVKK